MHRLQVDLVNTLGGNKADRGNAALPQPRLRRRGSRLLSLEEGLDEELSAQMIGADARQILLLRRVGDGIIAVW